MSDEYDSWRRYEDAKAFKNKLAEIDRLKDRIEKLEAALRFYACDCKPDDGCGIEYYDGGAYCGHAARKALEGKDA